MMISYGYINQEQPKFCKSFGKNVRDPFLREIKKQDPNFAQVSRVVFKGVK